MTNHCLTASSLAKPKEDPKEPEDTQNLRMWCFARFRWKLDNIQFVVNKRDTFQSGRNEASLTKRWALIQEQCTKFNASYTTMKKQKTSGIGVVETWCFKLWAT
jgi:hypothetical protein